MADEKAAAVYTGWATFKNALDGLAQGIPNKVDRSAFPGLSGGVQSQLLAGFKFLGMIGMDNTPTDALHAVAVTDEKARKEALKQILQSKYADLFALDLSKATPDEVNKVMGSSYNVAGDTKEKAVRFFLSAAQYVGVHLSRFLMKAQQGSPAPNGAVRVVRTRRSAGRRPASLNEAPPVGAASGTSRSVDLRSGGTLTISATLDLFSLSTEDRDFVFGLIDKLEKYAKEAGTEPQK